MAFGANVSFTNSEFATTFSKILNRRLVPTFGKISPFFANLFSELPENLKHTPFGYHGQMIRNSEGGRVRIHWGGAEIAVTAVSNPFAAATATAGTPAIATEAQLTRFNVIHNIDLMQLKYVKGNSATIDGYVEREAERVARSFLKKIATDFHGTGDQTQTTLGSWRRAIDIDDTVGSYLGILRADAANAGLRGQKIGTSGTAFSKAQLNKAINLSRKEGGNPDLVLAHEANYSLLQNELSGMDQIITPELTKKYGSAYLNFSGVPVCMDGYLDGINEVAVLDTSTWATSFDPSGFMSPESDLMRDITKMQALAMPLDLAIAIVCEQPRYNTRILTS